MYSLTYHLDIEGPVAKQIDRNTYSDLVNAHDTSATSAFKMPVEFSQDPSSDLDFDTLKIVVQILRITDEYIDALKRAKFDVSRILTQERLDAYEGKNNTEAG